MGDDRGALRRAGAPLYAGAALGDSGAGPGRRSQRVVLDPRRSARGAAARGRRRALGGCLDAAISYSVHSLSSSAVSFSFQLQTPAVSTSLADWRCGCELTVSRQRRPTPPAWRPSRPAVADGDRAMGVGGDVGLVGDEDDGVAGLVETREHAHDFDAGLRVEVAGRLVGEQDRRVVHQRARDGDALALTARQLVRPVRRARRQLDFLQSAPAPAPGAPSPARRRKSTAARRCAARSPSAAG